MATVEDDPLSPAPSTESSPVENLRRWEQMGGVWRVECRKSTELTVALLRCDGGEEIERLVSDDPDLVAFIAGRSGSDE